MYFNFFTMAARYEANHAFPNPNTFETIGFYMLGFLGNNIHPKNGHPRPRRWNAIWNEWTQTTCPTPFLFFHRPSNEPSSSEMCRYHNIRPATYACFGEEQEQEQEQYFPSNLVVAQIKSQGKNNSIFIHEKIEFFKIIKNL